MSNEHPRPTNFNREDGRSQPTWTDGFQGPRDDEISRTVNLREAQKEFGLTHHQVYMAVRRREIHALQLGRKGRIYYLADELAELARRVKAKRVYPFGSAA